ncbi:hypothetical protein HDV63DRAFT_190365 [Trichoderma sp. SZMC 28014]
MSSTLHHFHHQLCCLTVHSTNETPIDLQTADIAELKIQHVVTENKVWFVDIQQKRSQRAAENAAPDPKEFHLGTERFIQVRTPDELEPKNPNFPPVASLFNLVKKLRERLPLTDIGVLVSA